MTVVARGVGAARPQLIRAMNEQVLLDHIRRTGPMSRAELARISGLSKPTVSLALANIERAGLVHATGQRTGVPGPAAILYEVRPEVGYVLGLDVGRQFLRGAVADLAGNVRSRLSVRAKATTALARVRELAELAATLLSDAGLTAEQITQTVIGSPGVYDPNRNSLTLTGRLSGWDSPSVLAALRAEFGPTLMIENDVDAAALAERAHGHGRDVDSFAFVSVGTGIGMGLVIDGKLHRGSHGVAGEISYLPFAEGRGGDERDARKRGSFDATASAAAVVRAAKRAGVRGASSAERVFRAAAAGDPVAAEIVAEEALLVAKAVCAVITVADPELIVLGGGIGQAPGFIDAVVEQLRTLAPVLPEVQASVLGADSVVGGCIAAGIDQAWHRMTDSMPAPAGQ
ncbi:MAG TPA: ROK family protein [Mycobacteriales bacterium]|nr:ROK family protein [Mycobacteriales bacterium]